MIESICFSASKRCVRGVWMWREGGVIVTSKSRLFQKSAVLWPVLPQTRRPALNCNHYLTVTSLNGRSATEFNRSNVKNQGGFQEKKYRKISTLEPSISLSPKSSSFSPFSCNFFQIPKMSKFEIQALTAQVQQWRGLCCLKFCSKENSNATSHCLSATKKWSALLEILLEQNIKIQVLTAQVEQKRGPHYLKFCTNTDSKYKLSLHKWNKRRSALLDILLEVNFEIQPLTAQVLRKEVRFTWSSADISKRNELTCVLQLGSQGIISINCEL